MRHLLRTATLSLLATGACTLLAPAALAISPDKPSASGTGEPVRSIPDARGVRDWTHLDNRNVILSLNSRDTYLITLKHQCHGLAWAQNVQVSMSNDTIWAGFDAINADGLHCPIDAISKLTADDLLELDR